MIVGVVSIELFFPESRSLKDKRQILQSLRARIQARFNVSIAEVGYADKWQRAVLGVSMVNAEERPLREVGQKIRDLVRNNGGLYVLKESEEYFNPDFDP